VSVLDIDSATDLISRCPAYEPTPLLALTLNNNSIVAKDERGRFGLGAFKALGGVYAVLRLIGDKLPGHRIDPCHEDFRALASSLTFVCASAGNHGLAVAAGAALCGARSRVHLANSVPQDFAERLAHKGATVIRSGERYADAVAAAIADGKTTGHLHLADGSWPGYTEEPRLVMEGYTVMAEEMRARFEQDGDWPETVWLQAGVGGFAAAITHGIRERWQVQPRIVIVEPTTQASVAAALVAGEPVAVDGAESTMGRLDCEIASLLAVDILKRADVQCATVSDAEVAQTLAQLATHQISTTASGAAGLSACLRDGTHAERSLVVLTEA
jgi:diaminopropionate ammonia-lyase